MRLLHLVQPCPRPTRWYAAPMAERSRVSGIAPMLSIAGLQASLSASQQSVVLLGDAHAAKEAESAGLEAWTRVCPPLHSARLAGSVIRSVLRSLHALEGVVCWGGDRATWLSVRRRCVHAGASQVWLWVDCVRGQVQELTRAPGVCVDVRVQDGTFATGGILPRMEVPIVHDRVIGVLADAASPCDAGHASWLSSILHSGGLHHSMIMPVGGSESVSAGRRIMQDRGLSRQVLISRSPILAWLHACEAAVVLPRHGVCEAWGLATLARCAQRMGVPVVASASIAGVCAEHGVLVDLIASSNEPAQVARALIPALQDGRMKRATRPLQLAALPGMAQALAETLGQIAAMGGAR